MELFGHVQRQHVNAIPSIALLNIIETGSVSLSLPGEAAPSTKDRAANNCENLINN